MAPAPWLKRYFGDWYDKLNPSIVIDGKYYAVVRIAQVGKAAHVLVEKSGSHLVTPHTILHEGVPRPEDLQMMRARLTAKDAAGC